jgi:hypothetical protein
LKYLPLARYALLLVLTALFCWIVMMADNALRVWAALAAWGSGAARSLQYAVLALGLIGVLVCIGLLDKRFGRAKGMRDLLRLCRPVFAAQLLALGALSAVPAAAGLQGFLLPALALPLGAAMMVWHFLKGRASREQKRSQGKFTSDY